MIYLANCLATGVSLSGETPVVFSSVTWVTSKRPGTFMVQVIFFVVI